MDLKAKMGPRLGQTIAKGESLQARLDKQGKERIPAECSVCPRMQSWIAVRNRT